jgi:hypothetical protein
MIQEKGESPLTLKESRDFNKKALITIENLLKKEFNKEQLSGFCDFYERTYFSENSYWLPKIIFFEIKKDSEGNLYIFEGSTSANSGERKDYSYLRCIEKDGKYWGFQEWDTERDDIQTRKENRIRYNSIYENSESLLILKGYLLE